MVGYVESGSQFLYFPMVSKCPLDNDADTHMAQLHESLHAVMHHPTPWFDG